ncbi:MAG TPA: PAS domain S-box protein, partial [Leptospiraceae bacterium]|nr:PAS domain S-box protein [Leptospiraceae bacterium]
IVFMFSHIEPSKLAELKSISRYGFHSKNSNDYCLQNSIELALELYDSEKRLSEQISIEPLSILLNNDINSLLDLISDSIVAFNLDWRYTYVNKKTLNDFGLKEEDVIGKVYWELFPEVMGTPFLEEPKEAMRTQKKREFSAIYESYQMTIFIECHPFPNGILLIYRNISEKKKFDKKIKDTTNFLNSIIENIPNMIFMKDAKDLRFILFNRAGEELVGFNRKELIGKNDYDFFPKEQADFFTKKDLDVIHNGQLVDIPEEFINTPNGTRILHTKKLPLFNDRGEPEYLLGISEDITDKKEAEKTIQENIERYHRLTETVPGALYDYVLHPDGTSQMLYVSPKCLEIFELDPVDVMRDMTILWNLVHPDDIEQFKKDSDEAFHSKDHFSTEVRFIMPSGSEKWVQVTSRPNPKKDPDQPVVWSGFAIDITFRKTAEEKIKTLLGEKDLLLREVHHRIKNNMLTITSLLYLQTDSLQDKVAIEVLNDAISRIQSMVLLYDKLYMSSNYQDLSLFEYLIPLIDEIVYNFPNYRIVKVNKNIENLILPSSTLFSVGIILNELITNAMKYAFIGRESGLLTVSAYQEKDQIIFKVEDDGVGISSEQESKKGFGLQLVQMLSKQIHGKFRIERSSFSQFILSIPNR